MEQFLGLPPNGSAHGGEIDYLIALIHWLMLILFVGWGAFYIYTLIRFRRKANPSANYTGVKSHFSSYAEVGVLVVEVILLVAFSIPMWTKRVEAFPSEQEALTIRVVAEQFAWNIHYAGQDGKFGKMDRSLIDSDNPLGLDRNDADAKDDIFTINQLNLPVDKPVIIHLTTKDVIHSFGLPPYRLKHDAVPGISVPLWFTPTKTTDQIREEMRQPFSIAEAMGRVQMITLPSSTTLKLQQGSSYEKYLLTKDYAGADGSSLAAKGDVVGEDAVNALVGGGVTEVEARPAAALDKFVSADEHKNSSGEVAVAKSEMMTEDAVSKLMELGLREVKVRQASYIDPFVVMETYNDASGNAIAPKGEALSEEMISKLSEAGINEIVVAPATPTEIACAQLCGLGHYRMRGYVTVQTQVDFDQWMSEQHASVIEQYGQPATETSTTDSSATAASMTQEGH